MLTDLDTVERSAAPNTSRPRLAAVDIARGLALCGMILFHLDWDLAYLHWIDTSPANSPAWMAFGHLVAGSFLFLSGVGLVLAERAGPIAAVRRLASIAGAALAITAVTYWLFPQNYIFFGILHCIAVTNLIARPFLKAPIPVVAGAAGLAGIAPLLWASSRLGGPWWWWLGLSEALPRTLDYRPVLPWLALVLFGIGMARLCPSLPVWHARIALLKALAWAGRHSLIIYLAHQPLLLGALMTVGLAHGPSTPDVAADFQRECRAQCTATGAGRAGCEAACQCVYVRLGHLRDGGSSAPALLHPPTQEELRDAGVACLRLPSGDGGGIPAEKNGQ